MLELRSNKHATSLWDDLKSYSVLSSVTKGGNSLMLMLKQWLLD
jgi:hypothetical protein